MSSLRFDGALFIAYPQDHQPRHVHGLLGETEVVIDLRLDRTVGLADRPDAIRPANAKRSDVRRLLTLAIERFDELAILWEKMHG